MDKPTTFKFALQVKAMRIAQKQYFAQAGIASRSRVPADRAAANEIKDLAISLEKGVDEIVESVLLADPNVKNQLELIAILVHEAKKKLKTVTDAVEIDFGIYLQFDQLVELIDQIELTANYKEVING